MTPVKDIKTYIESRLNTKFIGRRLYYYQRLATTMKTAKELAKKGTVEGTVIIADTQTAGKGRLGRTWVSPEGSLAISIILNPSLNNLPQLVMIASLAVVRTIKKVAGIQAQIKWPNDVLIKGKKVCGILIENEVKGYKVNFAIIGIGINVNLDPLVFPKIADIATSLSHELGAEVSKAALLSTLLPELEQLYLDVQAGAPIYREWQKNMGMLGSRIQVKTGEAIEQGTAETVTENGSLVLRRSDGSIAEIVAGDVTVIKD
ncbi:MAG: biotin--[acetyl-CoA-carboxylase] ligase [Chloroflexi bacterium RBG_13_48_17]|jgi:BirA family biotin operon repressor/biotin-[acetyl-CoA-carboxylase] ligase|nr:MAG: biotin--[acetyl-CoA-carboxylase] ligase [Chloroflexi bacterium RBG_13_48_17]